MNRRPTIVSLAMAALLALWLYGCGGGHGTAGGNGGNGGGTAMTEQTRTAVLSAITTQYESLSQTSAKSDAAALLTFIKSRREFSASGIASDNSVWARFTDNSMLVIPLNQFPTPPGSRQAATPAEAARTRSTGAPFDLPALDFVYLINTRAINDPDVAQAFNTLDSDPGGYFPLSGYSVIPVNGTIEALRNIHDAGVLYNIGPAGIGYKGTPQSLPGTPTYILGTLTKRVVGSDSGYASDIANGRVAFMLIPTLQTAAGSSKTYTLASSYGITDAFVEQNWTFAANAVYVSDSPDGASAEAESFREALFSRPGGAALSVYLGWTGPVAARDAGETSLFLFDRLTASNDQSPSRQPEAQPQRPFNFQQILGQMATLHRTQPAGSESDLLSSTGTNSYDGDAYLSGPSHFRDFENPVEADANFGVLRPTISGALIDDDRRILTLNGTFGSDPGSAPHSVMIGDQDVTNEVNWSPTKLEIVNLSNTASGTIVVKVRDHESNHIQLTTWKGEFAAFQAGPGGESRSAIYNVQLRAILNFLRSSPGGIPEVNTPGAVHSVYGNSDCRWDAFGTDDEANQTETITRVGDPVIPLSNTNIIIGQPGRGASFSLALDFSTTPPKMFATVYAYVNDAGSLQITRTNKMTGATNSFNLPFFMNFNSEPMDTLDAAYNIKAGTWKSADGTFSIQWPDIPATAPPIPTEERSVHPAVRSVRHT